MAELPFPDPQSSWQELLRLLENLEVHHRKPRHFTKEELQGILVALYYVARQYA